ncbi:MAG: hypothetical protein GXO17_00610 [Thermodesulfobacteria bacterium]|nr:hypothetical protein [Thermodesulfobacteriota bacterium]
MRKILFWPLCFALILFLGSFSHLRALDMPDTDTLKEDVSSLDSDIMSSMDNQTTSMPSMDMDNETTCSNCTSMTVNVCSPLNYEQCMDRTSCEEAGGYWEEDHCVPPPKTITERHMVVAAARHLGPDEDVLSTAEKLEKVSPGLVQIGCVLLVPPEDLGKKASLLMYAYQEDWGWVDLSSMLETRETVLAQSVEIGTTVDTTPFAGKKFTLCAGYLTEDQNIGYYCYNVEVERLNREKAIILGEARHYQGEDILRMVRIEEQAQAGPASIGCDLLVPSEDQGKRATLLMYAYHEDWGWIDLSSMLETRETVLGPMVPVTADVDLTPLAGEEFVICGGYLTTDGQLGYLCYRLKIQ